MQINALDFAQQLKQQDNILILTHLRPDGDTVGCATALCRALHHIGKTAFLLQNPDITEVYRPYAAPFWAPEDFRSDCVVAVDVAALSMLPSNAAPYAGRIDLAVDHHPSQEFFARATFLDATAAACGELVYEICRALCEIDCDMAAALYLAIATDTGCFVYSNVTANTHRVTAELMATGFDAFAINKRHFRTKSRVRLALEAALISSMEFYDENRIAVLTLPLSLMAELGAREEDAEDISSLANLVEGVDCGVILRELKDGSWKISLRTGARVNATRACQLLGGGGHAAAAGCTVRGTLQEAKERILSAVQEVADA